MKFFIKLNLIFFILLSISQSSNAEEKKECNEYKKLSKEYLVCATKKLGKDFKEKGFKIGGKTPSEVKEEIKNY